MFVTRWNPNRDFINLTEQMNRLANDMFGEGETPETSMLKGTWNPPVDISEDKENFYLRVELPGLNREDIKVNYEDGLLTLTGEKKAHTEEKDTNYHRIERGYGKFERSFRLSSNIVNDKISADFSNGLLSITLPKAEQAKPKEIEVKVK